MAFKFLSYLFILTLCKTTLQNREDYLEENNSIIEDIKNEIGSEENMKNLNSALNNFMQTETGKQLENAIMDGINGAHNNNDGVMSQILQGVGTLMENNHEKSNKGETGTADDATPELMGNFLNFMVSQGKSEGDGGFDMGSLFPMLMNLWNQDSAIGFMTLATNMMQSFATSFTGPEAKKREAEHADHAWMLPPIVEKIHLFVDHFIHSEMGAALMEATGVNKILKLFADEDGKFSYPKFVEMFENHSFRRHWISMATKRLAAIISYFADPYTQKKFMTTFELFLDNFLKSQGVPKSALFDSNRPAESLTALANYVSKKYLKQKIDSKKYIQPAVAYVQELLEIAREKGIVGRGLDSEKLSHKIADTINLEMIEPVVRVNRAYRFATKVPKCDRYVMCLVNQAAPDEVESIPGLKLSLSRGASMLASWFLSSQGTTSFWSLYHVITEENNCQARYLDDCHDFHIEEIRVTTEYIHNEL